MPGALLRYSKHNQETTPIATLCSSEEMVTITDPRHPLYGRTFPLIHVTNRKYLGRCCVIRLQEGIERNVPIEATDHSPEPITIFPLPLDISSMRQLLEISERMITQLMEEPIEEKEDGAAQKLNTSRANLEHANHSATTNVVSSDSADLSNTDEDQQSQVCHGRQEDES